MSSLMEGSLKITLTVPLNILGSRAGWVSFYARSRGRLGECCGIKRRSWCWQGDSSIYKQLDLFSAVKFIPGHF